MVSVLLMIGIVQVAMSNFIAPESVKGIGVKFYHAASLDEDQRLLFSDAIGGMIQLWGVVRWTGYLVIAISLILLLRNRKSKADLPLP